MAKKLKVYYADVENMGDLLNPLLIKECFGYETVRRTYLTGRLSGIGSGLGNFTLSRVGWLSLLERMTAPFFSEVFIWGTGFIDNREEDPAFYRKGIRFCAVRGRYSKERAERILGRKLEIPMGDGGILASRLLKEPVEKRYDVGIIAHYKEQGEPEFARLSERFPNSIQIDVRREPVSVVRQIAECRTVLSSSLHGLIVADSFHIPNRHIVVTDKLLGDGFKFDDYYSAYGLSHEYTDLKREEIGDLESIVRQYRITPEMAEQKKREMEASFPFPSRTEGLA